MKKETRKIKVNFTLVAEGSSTKNQLGMRVKTKLSGLNLVKHVRNELTEEFGGKIKSLSILD